MSRISLIFFFLFAIAPLVRAVDAGQGTSDAQRLQAIADFTQRMKAANFPPLFEQAAKEFNVPPDVLKAVSFAETRWAQLQWPPGETASPETGMPRPYGIMSLWDNDYFGHTLQQAAQLINQSPDTLKTDVFQNMRGGAALLRQIYDATPKPADAPDVGQIESWRYAIAKYTGIPQPELSQAHALRVYEYMNLGFHEYGIEWDKHPVNLAPMRADVAKIKTEAQTRQQAALAETNADLISLQLASETNVNLAAKSVPVDETIPTKPTVHDFTERNQQQRWLLLGLMTLLMVIAIVFLARKKKPTTA